MKPQARGSGFSRLVGGLGRVRGFLRLGRFGFGFLRFAGILFHSIRGAQQHTLADQTALATVSVTLTSSAAPVPASADTGFLAGLKAGWSAFTAAMVAALTVIGALVPFLLVLVPLGLLAWWLVRRGSRRPVTPDEG